MKEIDSINQSTEKQILLIVSSQDLGNEIKLCMQEAYMNVEIMCSILQALDFISRFQYDLIV